MSSTEHISPDAFKKYQIGGAKKTEPASNLTSSKKGKYDKYQKKMYLIPDKFFVGKQVLYPFKVVHVSMSVEWMWVDIKSVKSPGKLNGILSNIPFGKTSYKLGSKVIVDKNLVGMISEKEKVKTFIYLMLNRGYSKEQAFASVPVYNYKMTQKYIDLFAKKKQTTTPKKKVSRQKKRTTSRQKSKSKSKRKSSTHKTKSKRKTTTRRKSKSKTRVRRR